MTETRIYDSQYGEVKLRKWFDCETDENGLDVYIGDNYDDYVGEIFCDIDDDKAIDKELDELFIK